MAAKTVKMCDMPLKIAVYVFEELNPETVQVIYDKWFCKFIIRTCTEPMHLVYPEGWYYAKGAFRNKHMSSTGMYEEAMMVDADGEHWRDIAKYCTLDD